MIPALLSRRELEALALRLSERVARVTAYVEDPGNWSALDGRRARLLDLLGGS